MALINCKECGKEISDTAKSCPNCGAKTKKEIFKNKRIFFIGTPVLLIVLLVIILIFIANPNTDNFSSEQVIKYLKNKGFTFDEYKIVGKNGTGYYIEAKKNNIEIFLMDFENTNPECFWRNTSISKSWANISEKGKNDDNDRKEQYEDFIKWSEKIKLTKKQICEAMEYYYDHTDNFRIKKQ